MRRLSRMTWSALALAAMAALATSQLSAEDPPKAKAKSRAGHQAHRDAHEPPPPMLGVCVLSPTQKGEVQGTITLEQMKGHVHLRGELTGLTPGMHGFHIHEFGDLRSEDGESAGGHYDPDGHKHGGPGDRERHAGDLGNIEADEEGRAKIDVMAEGLELHFVIGRSLVVHADPDDFESQPSGMAGARVAVGVIGIAQHDKSPSAGNRTARTRGK